MQERVLGFDKLAGKIQLTQLCEKKITSNILWQPGSSTKFDGDDGWGTITPVCREYSISRYFPKAQALAAILEGIIIGPVLEVHFVKILDGHGIEVAIPSFASNDTSYVVISRETKRFVNEIHDHKEELRSSNELLTDLQEVNSFEEKGNLSAQEHQ